MKEKSTQHFKIATWNINSIRVRLPQIIDWLKANKPDILALQETKVTDEQFPTAAFEALHYQVVFSGQKTFNGVALITRQVPEAVEINFNEDGQKRFLAATIDPFRIVNIYVPNGESVDSPKYSYKLHWLEQLKVYLRQQLKQHKKMIVLGDFNIAPKAEDVHDPERWAGQVLFSEPERTALQAILAIGFKDAFRLFPQPEKSFSWWDYRASAFRRNWGLRIDLILVSDAFTRSCVSCTIDKTPRANTQPSDHTPVIASFDRE